jgi:uncharacterized protein YndB with AHSA1/START domain
MPVKSSIDLDRDPRAIIGTRELDAPRELVFAAWTDPKHLAQWWEPNGFSTTTMSFDLRPGGVWRFVMHGPDGRDYQNRITFEEVVPPERIVYRHSGGDDRQVTQPLAKTFFSPKFGMLADKFGVHGMIMVRHGSRRIQQATAMRG